MNENETASSMSEYAGRESGRWISMQGEVKYRMRANKIFRTKGFLLEYFIQEGTWPGKSDKHHTWTNWYCKKDRIVCSIGETKMLRDTGVPRSTLKRWIVELEDEKLIQRKYEWGELVIVLGKRIDGVNVYFYEML